MTRLLLPLAATVLFAASLSAGTVLEQINFTFPNQAQYAFQLNGFNLSQSEALVIEFDPSVYLSLTNASAPSGFSVFVLQPGNPPGTPGDLIFEEMTGGPVLSSVGAFNVGFTLSTFGQAGSLPFSLYNLNTDGTFGNLIQSGTTIAVGASPEPVNFALVGIGLLAAAMRKRIASR